MTSKIALIGRPNVGKSTLFNRLIRSNRAITHDRPGVTRDRMEGTVRRGGEEWTVIDTGGVTLDENQVSATEGPNELRGFEEEILRGVTEAIGECVALCLVVDGRDGLLPFDRRLANFARKTGKPVLLAVNKVDGGELEEEYTAEFHELGLPIIAISGEHGFQMRAFEEALRDMLPEEEDEDEFGPVEDYKQLGIKIAMLGRPNAGKSSLINAMTQSERMIVSNVAGTTRDSVDVTYEADDKKYTFVDTAGVRRRTKISDTVERYSVNSSIKSSTKANVTLLVIDGQEGLTSQDKRLIKLLDERKTPFMVLINKTDLVEPRAMKDVVKQYKQELAYCGHVPVVHVSAHSRMNLKKILPLAEKIWAECSVRVPTSLLNRTLEAVVTKHQPPVVKRVRPKFFFMTQAETLPPTFVFFCNDHERLKEHYIRYLEKAVRKAFKIEHAPIRLKFRSSHSKRSFPKKKKKK
ncbi:MAG: ribosome biogenesis GTPase Der [Desulfovibrionales bacterium]|nr:ribosome biogenesis GTPase Der [Desulfovibrionales bacterium]